MKTEDNMPCWTAFLKAVLGDRYEDPEDQPEEDDGQKRDESRDKGKRERKQ